MNELGNRMKEYEDVNRSFLIRRTPVILRLDGKAFHTFTRQFSKPFDSSLIRAMNNAARTLMKEVQGSKLYYHQSDEVSILITDYDKLETDSWFHNNIQKMVSVASSIMTAAFNDEIREYTSQKAFFDARVFNIPVKEVTNYFLWRAKDWERNSLQMYAGSFFSHKELQSKNKQDKHNMLHEIGKNWTTDLDDVFRNGTFCFHSSDQNLKFQTRHDIEPVYEQIDKVISGVGVYD